MWLREVILIQQLDPRPKNVFDILDVYFLSGIISVYDLSDVDGGVRWDYNSKQ